MSTVPTPTPAIEHPSWCNQAGCTFASSIQGSHVSVPQRFDLLFDGLPLRVFMEHEAGTPEPIVTFEKRACGCSDCEGGVMLSFSLASARRLLSSLGSLIGDEAQP